jgi:hypothetical protein
MATKSNPITIYLYDKRNMTLSLWAKKHGFNATSVRNTFYGIRPIKKIVTYIEANDTTLFNLLPVASKEVLENVS